MAEQIDIHSARAWILAHTDAWHSRPDAVSRVTLASAVGHCLAAAVYAPLDVPSQDVSAMDGYAIAAGSGAPPLEGMEDAAWAASNIPGWHQTARRGPHYRLIGRSLAGHPFTGRVGRWETVEIATGGWLPQGCDTVVAQEDAQQDSQYDAQWVTFQGACEVGQHVRRRGEVMRQGTEVFPAGTRIQWQHLGLLASLGIAALDIVRPPRVAVFSSGDELTTGGSEQPQAGHFDANRPMLLALLQHVGCEAVDGGVLPDNRAAIEARLQAQADTVDVLVTSGGVSRGWHDDVRHAFEHLASFKSWQLRHKPGRALLFGRLGRAVMFGLPGNPLAALATAVQLLLPALQQLAGRPSRAGWQRARLAEPVQGKAGRHELLLGHHWIDDQGQLWLAPLPMQNSHRVDMLTQATCLIELDELTAWADAGASCACFPLAGVAS